MNRPNVIVTTSWDDGHVFDMRTAKLLKRYGIKATFYISPKDHEFKTGEHLTPQQLKQLAKDFEIGAHTMTHPHLSQLSKGKARKEIKDSKTYLEEILGKKVTSFCYPYGDFSAETKQIVKQLGFKYARSVRRFSLQTDDQFAASTTVDTYDHMKDGLRDVARLCGWRLWQINRLRQWDQLARYKFDEALRTGGVFHLWGHSQDLQKRDGWKRLESLLAYIAKHKDVVHLTNGQLPERKPKLLLAAPYFPPKVGGLEHYAYHMALGARDTYDVVVITSGEQKHITQSVEDGLRVYRLPTSLKLSNTPIGFRWRKMVKQIIAEEKPDVVNVHMPVPFLPDIVLATAKNSKRIVTYHSGTMRKNMPNHSLANILVAIYEYLMLPRVFKIADVVLCSSDFVRDNFLKKHGLDAVTITPGVDLKKFKPRRSTPKTRDVLFIGNFAHKDKGLDYLIEAVQMIPDTRLVVVGNGSQITQPQVSYAGVLHDDKLVKRIQASRVLVLPSITDSESFGMVLLEAMACGVPAIGSDIGGIPTVIDNGKTGLLVPPCDVSGLAEAITSLLHKPDHADRLSKNAYQKVLQKFNWDSSIQAYLNLLDDVQERTAS